MGDSVDYNQLKLALAIIEFEHGLSGPPDKGNLLPEKDNHSGGGDQRKTQNQGQNGAANLTVPEVRKSVSSEDGTKRRRVPGWMEKEAKFVAPVKKKKLNL